LPDGQPDEPEASARFLAPISMWHATTRFEHAFMADALIRKDFKHDGS
jgi:hypothetical protein